MLHPQIRLRIQPPRRNRRPLGQRIAGKVEVRFADAMLAKFRARHSVLLGRYERMVQRCDVLESRRDAVARQIRALDRAIAALERYPRK
jgi:hypothetical protein